MCVYVQALRRATTDWRLLHLSVLVFLSYLSEAGQYSCFFLYLRQVSPSLSITLSLLYPPPPLSLSHTHTHTHTHSLIPFSSLLSPSLSHAYHAHTNFYSLTHSHAHTPTQVAGFTLAQVAVFIAVLCLTSVLAQTLGLTLLMSLVGNKYSIIVGLVLQAVQLVIYGVWTTPWCVGSLSLSLSLSLSSPPPLPPSLPPSLPTSLSSHTHTHTTPPRLMWLAGMLASSASIIYPAISAMVSRNADPEQQGVVLGILTGHALPHTHTTTHTLIGYIYFTDATYFNTQCLESL